MKICLKTFTPLILILLFLFNANSVFSAPNPQKAYDLFNAQKYAEALRVLDSIPYSQMNDSLKILRIDACIILKKNDKAERLCRDYLKVNSASLKVRFKLAEILSWAGRYDESITEYEKILAKSPDDIQVRRKLAFVLSWKSDFESAIKQLNPTLATRKQKTSVIVDKYSAVSDVDAEVMLGNLYVWTKKYNEAVEIFEKIIKKEPQNKKARIGLADVYLYSKNLPKAVENYKIALEENPTSEEIKKKYAFALNWNGDYEEAFPLLSALYEKSPNDIELAIELARDYSKRNNTEKAVSILEPFLASAPGNIKLIEELAWMKTELGNASAVRELYLKAVKITKDKEATELYFADLMNLWGDFYKIEKIYRDYLARNPDDFEINMKLARVLASEERYEEAEEIYNNLSAKNVNKEKVLIAFSELGMLKKDFKFSLEYAKAALADNPKNMEAIKLYAEALFKVKNYTEALTAYKTLSEIPAYQINGLLGEQEIYVKLGDKEKAEAAFESVKKIDPANIEAQFLHDGPQNAAKDEYLSRVFENYKKPRELKIWAEMFEKAGLSDGALKCYEESLKKDASYFPAEINVAVNLAVKQKYDESLKILNNLLAEFPDDYKILIWKARVEAWSKRYADSLKTYDEIIRLNPGDPVPPLEAARSANWANMYDLSNRYYDSILKTQKLPALKKSISLEMQAKNDFKDKKFIHSMRKYNELTAVNPGNEEALFDYAQTQCILGLSDESKKTYGKLLEIDPMHSIAQTALDKMNIKERPDAQALYSYWNEAGYGDLAQIMRRRIDILVELHLPHRYNLRFAGNTWEDKPHFNDVVYGAKGYSIEGDAVFNEYAKAAAGFTSKAYDNNLLGARNTGFLNLYLNLNDRARVILGYDKRNETYNLFGLFQGTQSKNLTFEFNSNLNRKLTVNGSARFINYSDSNFGKHYILSAGYDFMEFPRSLSLVYTEEYRNTINAAQYVYSGPTLNNIIYPYWTPQNYTAGTISLIWRQDISKQFFCGNNNRYYDVKVALGNDSNSNPSRRLEAGFYYELDKKWTLGVKGLVHKSPQWDASGLWGELKCRF